MFDKIRSRWVTSDLMDSGENPPMISATSGPVEARYHSDDLNLVLSEYEAAQETRNFMLR